MGGRFMVLSGMNVVHAAELTMAEKGIASAKVILTGFVVVFAVLLLLILVIKLYSFLVGKAQGAGKKKKKDQTPPPKKTVTSVTSEPAPVSRTASAGDEIPEEVVAVIAAAVASMYGGSQKARIKSIRKAGGRSAWANAGVLDNTRPF